MKRSIYKCIATMFCSVVVAPVFGQTPPPPPTPDGEDPLPKGASVQMRGPVHEAFAQPYVQKPSKGFELPQAPPKPIEELPPSIGPKDDDRDLTWIPGYWAWDGERYVWISGMWRYSPPGTRWVPGHWVRTSNGGCVWVSGFWVRDDVKHLGYLPPPPEPKQLHPTSEPPYENAFWVPGCWLYKSERYVWREGFWSRGRPDWVWAPARYIWTPRGYIFVSGYWDYRPERRGTLFAPIHFSNEFRGRYRPNVLLNIGSLFVHLFTQPRYNHYYFGNYYGSGNRWGVYPWLSYGQRNRYYDPLLTYYAAVRGDDLARIRRYYGFFEANAGKRPPAAWSNYGQYLRSFGDQTPSGAILALQASQALRDSQNWRLQPYNKKRIAPYAKGLQYYENLTTKRNQFEARPKGKAGGKPFRNFNVPPGQIRKSLNPGKGNKGTIINPGKGNKGRFIPPGQLRNVVPQAPRFVPNPNQGRPPIGFPGKGKGKGRGKGKGKGRR